MHTVHSEGIGHTDLCRTIITWTYFTRKPVQSGFIDGLRLLNAGYHFFSTVPSAKPLSESEDLQEETRLRAGEQNLLRAYFSLLLVRLAPAISCPHTVEGEDGCVG